MKNDNILINDCAAKPAGKGVLCDSPRKSYASPRAKLKCIGDVQHELAKLYREARAGKVDTQDASRLANMLSILGRMIEGANLEKRITELEQAKGR